MALNAKSSFNNPLTEAQDYFQGFTQLSPEAQALLMEKDMGNTGKILKATGEGLETTGRGLQNSGGGGGGGKGGLSRVTGGGGGASPTEFVADVAGSVVEGGGTLVKGLSALDEKKGRTQRLIEREMKVSQALDFDLWGGASGEKPEANQIVAREIANEIANGGLYNRAKVIRKAEKSLGRPLDDYERVAVANKGYIEKYQTVLNEEAIGQEAQARGARRGRREGLLPPQAVRSENKAVRLKKQEMRTQKAIVGFAIIARMKMTEELYKLAGGKNNGVG